MRNTWHNKIRQLFTFLHNFQGLSNRFIHSNRVIKGFDSLAIVMSVINASRWKQDTRNIPFKRKSILGKQNNIISQTSKIKYAASNVKSPLKYTFALVELLKFSY